MYVCMYVCVCVCVYVCRVIYLEKALLPLLLPAAGELAEADMRQVLEPLEVRHRDT